MKGKRKAHVLLAPTGATGSPALGLWHCLLTELPPVRGGG